MKKLLRNLWQGEEKAFDECFRLYFNLIYASVKTIVKNPTITEDICAETFKKLWEDRATIAIDTSLKAYLQTMAKNKCIDHLRNLKHVQKVQQALMWSANEAEEIMNREFEIEDVIHVLRTEMEKLPRGCREILKAYYVHNKSLREIAIEARVSIGTVKSQKSRAIELLRRAIKNATLF